MAKNGMVALIIHGVIGFVSFFIFTLIINMSGANDNDIAYDIIIRIASVLIFIGAALVYFLLGKKCLHKDSKLQSYSVWIVSLIGIVLWIMIYCISGGTRIDVSQNVNWALYCLYNAYFFPVMVAFGMDNPYYIMLFAVVPSALLWLGLKTSNNRRNI